MQLFYSEKICAIPSKNGFELVIKIFANKQRCVFNIFQRLQPIGLSVVLSFENVDFRVKCLQVLYVQ